MHSENRTQSVTYINKTNGNFAVMSWASHIFKK